MKNKKLINILVLVLILSMTSLVSGLYYNMSYGQYIMFNASNTTMPLTNYTHKLVINESMGGFDYDNATIPNIVLIDGRFDNTTSSSLDYFVYVWNTTGNSVVYFKTRSSIVSQITMFFNASNSANSSNLSRTFDLFTDDFQNLNQWSTGSGVCSVSGGILYVEYAGDNLICNTTRTFMQSNISFIASMDWNSSAGGAQKMIGFSSTSGFPWGETDINTFLNRDDVGDASTITNIQIVSNNNLNPFNATRTMGNNSIFGNYLPYEFYLNDSRTAYTHADSEISVYAQATNSIPGTRKSFAFTHSTNAKGILVDFVAIRNWTPSEPAWTQSSYGTNSSPNITIYTPTGTLATTSVSYNFSAVMNGDILSSCYYNITREISGGQSAEVADTLTTLDSANYTTGTASVSGSANYVFWGRCNNSAGNIGYSNSTFVVSAGGSGGGGGGGGIRPTITIPVIGLQKVLNSEKDYSNLAREVFYATINNYCSEKIRGESLAVADYSDKCSLTINDISEVRKRILNFKFDISLNDTLKSFDYYKTSVLFQGYEDKETITKYSLFTSILGMTNLLQLFPPSVDQPKIIFVSPDRNYTIASVISSNKPLKSCEVTSSTPNLKCEVTNSTIKVFYHLKDTNFFSEIFSGTIVVRTDAPANQVEQKSVSIVFRVYNLSNKIVGIPSFILIPIGLFSLGYGLYKYKKRIFRAFKIKGL